MKNVEEIRNKLTLEEKVALTTGADFWSTVAIPEKQVPGIRVSDGPHGLSSPADSSAAVNAEEYKAVCFPTACATGSSFEPELLQEMGGELARQCRAVGADILLGPGINIKRSPLCGRDFEYFSEDPYLSGAMGNAFVKGVQDGGAGVCLKHFAMNNQEYRRNDSSSNVDERTMREIYLPAFERVVKEAKPTSVMAAYNRINGTYATENKEMLGKILRDEWGFEGAVISDWSAVHDRVAAIQAGCDLTMPSDTEHNDLVLQALKEGTLTEEDLDACVDRLLTLAMRRKEPKGAFDYERGHALAKQIEEAACVLLQNDGILPLDKKQKVAFLGQFADKPRYQGGGSSHVRCSNVVGAYAYAKDRGYDVTYAQAYDSVETNETLLQEALSVAKEADSVVIFAGLLEVMESEGNDRKTLDMPESHNRLIREVAQVNPNVVVVLYNGSPVTMPWLDQAKAVLEMYLGGEAVGEASVDTLFGISNPSGHLAETFPKRLQDSPSYLWYGGEGDQVNYSERFFVGYRYSTSKEIDPLFAFGHGLSYTTFAYEDLKLQKDTCTDTDKVMVSVAVKNTGKRKGKALVQLYVAPPMDQVIRPVRELKRFAKVELEAGEKKEVSFIIEGRDFAHWSEDFHDWRVETGTYQIQICENAHKPLLAKDLEVKGSQPIRKVVYAMPSPLSEVILTEEGYALVDGAVAGLVYGLQYQGFFTEDFVKKLTEVGDGVINIASVKKMALDRKACSNQPYDLANLLDTTLEVLQYFITEEQKKEMMDLIASSRH